MLKYIEFIPLAPLALFEMTFTWSLLTALYILFLYLLFYFVHCVISFSTWIMFQNFSGRSVSGKPSRF